MLQQSPRINSKCAALDNVLGGGLKRCHMLEISGPPGSPKEKLLINLVSVFADADEDIIFVGKRSYAGINQNPFKPCQKIVQI